MSDQDGNPFYGVKSVSVGEQPPEISCTANDQEETINSLQVDSCFQMIISRCKEVKPPVCPCFDAEDLMSVTEDNVAEDACKNEGSRLKLVNADGFVSFEISFIQVKEHQCSGRDLSTGLDTNVIFQGNDVAEECYDLITNRCEDIGRPIGFPV